MKRRIQILGVAGTLVLFLAVCLVIYGMPKNIRATELKGNAQTESAGAVSGGVSKETKEAQTEESAEEPGDTENTGNTEDTGNAGNMGNTGDTNEGTLEENTVTISSFGKTINYGRGFSDSSGIAYWRVEFTEDGIGVSLPAAIWDPDNFYNVKDEGMEEEAVDEPLTDWMGDNSYTIVVPSTGFFSMVNSTCSEEELKKVKSNKKEELCEESMKECSNFKAEGTILTRKVKDAYLVTRLGQFKFNFYDQDFSYYGYWISVYRKGKRIDFSYGERREEESKKYFTYEKVLKSFYLMDLEKEPERNQILK